MVRVPHQQPAFGPQCLFVLSPLLQALTQCWNNTICGENWILCTSTVKRKSTLEPGKVCQSPRARDKFCASEIPFRVTAGGCVDTFLRCYLWSNHAAHYGLGAAAGRWCLLKMPPSPSTSRGPSCGAPTPLCAAARGEDPHCSIKIQDVSACLFPAVCVAWRSPGVGDARGRAGWDPHSRSPPSHNKRSTWVPKATELCQGHRCYGKSTLLYT